MTAPHRHRPRKRFGQNFLHDPHVIAAIIRAIDAAPGDHVVEIGPGRGALTRHLAGLTDRLEVIELDRDLVAHLKTLNAQHPFIIHQGDILKFDLARLTRTPRSLRIVGNLPYNISTPVLFHLLDNAPLIRDMTFMLQLEVVQRMAARSGDEHYGRLSVMLQYHCKVEQLFKVPAGAFYPAPKVTSAVARLTPYPSPPLPARDPQRLQEVVRTAFNQRRKTLKNSLKNLISEEQWRHIPVDPRSRPEMLGVADYVTISDALTVQH